MKRTPTIQHSKKSRVTKNVISAVLILYSLIAVFLIGDTVLSSFKTKPELIRNLIGFPQEPTFENYKTVFLEESFWRYILNS
nr:carbohydrate ABC transporter permease [Candidatus Limiplasma sp.]